MGTSRCRSMGGYAGADRCCRQHDLGCSISIEPGTTQYGLTNQRIHTVMHCSCDERFRSCLKMARTQAADIVGNLFFNIADIPCFVFSKEVVSEAVLRRSFEDFCMKIHLHLHLWFIFRCRRIFEASSYFSTEDYEDFFWKIFAIFWTKISEKSKNMYFS